MFRESLPERSGMLFLFRDAAPHQFWMKNTMIPLDIVWLDDSGRVVFVSANTPPSPRTPARTRPAVPARGVLEIAGGMAAKEKVTVGSASGSRRPRGSAQRERSPGTPAAPALIARAERRLSR